jgi:hypothetical protein
MLSFPTELPVLRELKLGEEPVFPSCEFWSRAAVTPASQPFRHLLEVVIGLSGNFLVLEDVVQRFGLF